MRMLQGCSNDFTRHIKTNTGQEVWVSQLSGDVESEVGAELDDVVSQVDARSASLLEGLLQQHRLQQRV